MVGGSGRQQGGFDLEIGSDGFFDQTGHRQFCTSDDWLRGSHRFITKLARERRGFDPFSVGQIFVLESPVQR